MIARLLAAALLQLPVQPVLDFPEPGLDDTAAYRGYQTRFYRDSRRNTVQIYLDPQSGRVVTLWADATNASVGFTARSARAQPLRLEWAGETADVADSGRMRTLEYGLESSGSVVRIGGFLLGSMRVERDLQYARRHLLPFSAAPLRVAEESLLVADLARLPEQERRRHLALLNASSLAELRSRLEPSIAFSQAGAEWSVRAERPSLDGKNRLVLELRGKRPETTARVAGQTVSIRARPGAPVRFRVRLATDGAVLTPLGRDRIFNRTFLDFLSAASTRTDSAARLRYRRLERQVRAVELLSSQEKLMAGLPNFATYFGRDMMMTALMMQPIWAPETSEHVIASVLQKLGPDGQVSHEEALGGQATREHAQVYDSILTLYFRSVRAGRRAQGDSLLARARDIFGDLQATRENYHMIDDEFQLPVVAARYLADSLVPAARKRAFLGHTLEGGRSRLDLLFDELALVARQTRPYVDDPRAANLVSFPRRDSLHWRAASWRDSDAGYAGGRFAMDVNAIWVPNALESIATIVGILPRIGISDSVLHALVKDPRGSPLAEYARDSTALRRAIETWRRAREHFVVTLSTVQIRRGVQSKLQWLSAEERRYWETAVLNRGWPDSLTFMALALDSAGAPIPIVNTDPATALLLEAGNERSLPGAADADVMLQELEPFLLHYPIGLFVAGLGPMVANDAYAPRSVWERFRKDRYHGPRVVWGREVNLLLIGLAQQIASAHDTGGRLRQPPLEAYVRSLEAALCRTLAAVQASGLEHNELWSYRIRNGRLQPVRYGTSSDIQLWNTTDLAVEFVLSRGNSCRSRRP